MDMLQVGDVLINRDMIAWVKREQDGTVHLHFPVPIAVPLPRKSALAPTTAPAPPPTFAASDHYVLILSGNEADEAWKQLGGIVP